LLPPVEKSGGKENHRDKEVELGMLIGMETKADEAGYCPCYEARDPYPRGPAHTSVGCVMQPEPASGK